MPKRGWKALDLKMRIRLSKTKSLSNKRRFGIIVVRVVEIGAITPPFSINVFVMKNVAKDIPIGTIYRGIVPFFISDLVHVALLIAFPSIAMFLPALMKG